MSLNWHEFVNSALKSNQFAQGGLVLMVVGGILAYCRRVPGAMWRWVKNRLLFTVEVDNTDQSFHWMQAWLASRGKGRFVQARARFDGDLASPDVFHGNSARRQGPTFDLSPRSFTTFRFKGSRVMAWLNKEPVQNSNEYRQSITLQFLAVRGVRQLAQDLLGEAYELVVGKSGKIVEIWSASLHGDWQLADRRPVRPLETLVLADGMKELIFDDAKKFLTEKKWYQSMGVPWRRGYLLHGPAGSGKSSLAHVLASELGLNLFTMNLASVGDGGLERSLQNVPEGAILLIEDIDTAFQKRKKSQETHVSFAGLLNALDGVAAKEGRIVIMTTNHKHLLDPALIRPGRADVHVLLDDATAEQAQRMFDRFFPEAPEGLSGAFAGKWSGRSMAAIQNTLLTHRHDPAAAASCEPPPLPEPEQAPTLAA